MAANRSFCTCIALALLVGCKKPPTKKDALARIEAMKPKLAKVRRLAFETDVPAAYQTADEFRDYMRRAVAKEGESLAGQSEALVALGLLPQSTDLGKSIENAYATQAAAYYDFDAKRFFLVMVPESEDLLDIVGSHELTHGLQDQHFGLKAYLSGAGNADARTARRFVVEGDAMLSAIAYLVYAKTNLSELTHDQVKAMRPKLEELAAADPSTMAATLRAQASASKHMDPQIQKSLDAMDTIPRTVLVPLLDSYMKGVILALEAYDRGGWRAVDALYKEPPESTEQAMHPVERFLAGTDRPKRVTLPKLDGYSIVASDVLGELQWGVYFSLWKHEGERPQQNWGGDRYAVVRDGNDKLISLIATVWDHASDAAAFYDAYVSTVKARYGGETSVTGDQTLVEHGEQATWIYRSRELVVIVDGGANDGKLLVDLVEGTKFE